MLLRDSGGDGQFFFVFGTLLLRRQGVEKTLAAGELMPQVFVDKKKAVH
ncbi:MAG: hypothetical protein KKD63_06075 [Proteobacteria bacterium]|nr:hypothetical protein [Pseudomonadota bacterium]